MPNRRRVDEKTREAVSEQAAAPQPASEKVTEPPALTLQNLLHAQQTVGNAAVGRMIARQDADMPPQPAPAVEEGDAQAVAVAEQLKGAEDNAFGQRIEITEGLLSLMLGNASQPSKLRKHKDATYEKHAGDVSGKGAKPEDVKQGALGDCYLLAALAAVARANPKVIEEMIKDNGDGTYDVSIYVDKGWFSKDLQKQTVKVDATFPTKDGKAVYAKPGEAGPSGPRLWVMLIEKAYAKLKGGYDDIEGGFGAPAMEAITGKASQELKPKDYPDDILASMLDKVMKEGHAVTVGADWYLLKSTKEKAAADGIPSLQHEYALKGVDVKGQTIDLQNPWGHSHIEKLPMDKFKKWFNTISTNPTK